MPNIFRDWNDETRPVDDYYYDLLAANVTFHAHAKSTGYDTLHVVGPAATFVINPSHASNALLIEGGYGAVDWSDLLGRQ